MAGPLADALFWIAVAATAMAHARIFRSTLRGMRSAPATVRPFWEWTWAVLPALSLVVLLVWTWRTMHPASFSFEVPDTHGPPGRIQQ